MRASLASVMIGRAAYHDPASVLIGADALWGDDFAPDAISVANAMRPYIADHLASGGRLQRSVRRTAPMLAPCQECFCTKAIASSTAFTGKEWISIRSRMRLLSLPAKRPAWNGVLPAAR
jgi:tRNA-dihydrouridine synthase